MRPFSKHFLECSVGVYLLKLEIKWIGDIFIRLWMLFCFSNVTRNNIGYYSIRYTSALLFVINSTEIASIQIIIVLGWSKFPWRTRRNQSFCFMASKVAK